MAARTPGNNALPVTLFGGALVVKTRYNRYIVLLTFVTPAVLSLQPLPVQRPEINWLALSRYYLFAL